MFGDDAMAFIAEVLLVRTDIAACMILFLRSGVITIMEDAIDFFHLRSRSCRICTWTERYDVNRRAVSALRFAFVACYGVS